jgi:hypothetical protein
VSNRSAAELDRYYLTTYQAYSLEHDNSVDYGAAPPTYAEIGSPDLTEQGLNYDLELKRGLPLARRPSSR